MCIELNCGCYYIQIVKLLLLFTLMTEFMLHFGVADGNGHLVEYCT